jgi:hypothetical protein
MRRVALGLVLVSLFATSGIAHAANGKHGNWKSVERLALGIPVEVQSVGQAGVEDCSIVHVDDAALTCQREPDPNANWGPGDNARLVFPRDTVRDVWVIEPASNRHIAAWIAVAVVTGVGIAVCVEGGPEGALFFLLLALPVAVFAESPQNPWPSMPAPAPQPQRMHRQLVYHSATP